MDESTLQKIRKEKLEKLHALGVNPYPASFDKKQSIAQVVTMEGQEITTAGKLFSLREHGNIAFADLHDETGKVQIFFQKKLMGDAYKLIKLLDIGDYIGVKGLMIKTVAGEISVAPTELTFLGKSLRPLPSEWFGLKDTETRYRQRYLDLLLNGNVRERFNKRTKLITAVREYLDGLGFWEVETPTLQPLYGGANAKPFITHLHALDQDVYLRIADELYLKRLIAGGYERVYEICKDFRNEGIDHTHFPEFTMIEWYEAYADYHRMMDVAEGLLKHIAHKLFNSTIISIGEAHVDIGKNWPRIEMTQVLQDKLGLSVEEETQESLQAYIADNCPGIQLVGGETKGQLIFAIFDHKIPKLLTEPTWIIDYPQDVSPLSKSHRSKPGWVERFEGYVGGKEIFDGWSELTDPRLQRDTLTKDANAVRKDKEEAQHIDEDFLTAMEYGMPPFGGIGIGIDRLTMLFTNTWAIKEVVLFPTLKRELQTTVHDKTVAASEVCVAISSTSISTNSMTREAAYTLLTQYITQENLIRHCLAAEAAMKGIYKKLHQLDFTQESEAMWGITGLLHDIDYEIAQNENALDKHGILLFERNPDIIPEPMAHAIKSHNFSKTDIMPESDLDWAITTVDQLTGLIISCALIHPDKEVASITPKFVLKKFNTPSFSKGVDRNIIMLCETKLGIPLEDFITTTLHAMQKIAVNLEFSTKKEYETAPIVTAITTKEVAQDFSRKIVVVLNKDLPQWQAMNAVAHISAYIGNKMDQVFDTGEAFIGKDKERFPRNTQYPIIALSAKIGQMQNLYEKIKVSGLLYHVFIREMIETTDDKEIEKIISNKDALEVEILGIGIFGLNQEVEKLTKNYSLWK